jgi:Tol biopolymer transport system component
MNRRFGFVLGISGLVGLALLGGGAVTSLGAGRVAPNARAVPRAGIVSLDLRTHKERVFPLGDLDALSPEGKRVAEARNQDNKKCLLFVNRLDGSNTHVLVRTAFPTCPAYPRWSPDGRMIAYSLFTKCAVGAPGCHPVQLWVVRISDGAPSLLSNDADIAAWAPSSRRLAFPGELDGGGRSKLTVENRDGTARIAFGSRHEIYSVSWSGDGRRVLYSTHTPYFQNGGTGEIHAVSVATGTDLVVASGVDPAWSRDSRFLSFIRRTGNRTTLFLTDGRRVRTILGRRNHDFVHAWSRRGHRLAFAITNRFGQARVFVYDPGRPRPLRAVTRGRYGPVRSIAWSPDGRRLLFVRTRG